MKTVICGGIGSGKSTVMNILRELGASVISADEVNKSLLMDEEYLGSLKELFPEAFECGVFSKSLLSKIIFSDSSSRKMLEDLAHPIIMNKIIQSDAEFAEVPLMKAEYADYFDSIWYVEANDESRISRVVDRDSRTTEDIMRIMDYQSCILDIKSIANVIINNDGDYESLVRRVRGLYCENYQS